MRAQKKQKLELPTIGELGNQFKTGSITGIPRKFVVDLEKLSRDDFQTLIELARHKTFAHKIIHTEIDASTTSKKTVSEPALLRSLLNVGAYEEVLDRGTSPCASASDSEAVEREVTKVRALAFVGDFSAVIAVIEPLIANGISNPATRGVAHQLLGQALFEVEETEKAKRHLNLALELALFTGNQLGVLAARLFLTKLFAARQETGHARSELESALKICHGGVSFRWLLGYYRTLSHVHYFDSSPRCLDFAYIGVLIANAIGDQLYVARGLIEILFMQRKWSLGVLQPEELLSFAKKHIQKSDLDSWINTYERDSIADRACFTLRLFHRESVKQSQGDCPLSMSSYLRQDLSALSTYSWIYDPMNGIFIDLKEGISTHLDQESPMAQIIVNLNRAGAPMAIGDVFESVWRLPWDPNRHLGLLKVTVARVSKLSKSMKLSWREKKLSFVCGGWVV